MNHPRPGRTTQVLRFIRAYVAKHQEFPPAHIIRDHMGWKNIGSVKDCLARLKARGDLVVVERMPIRRGWLYRYSLPEERNAP
jgi:hypothetical protein